MKKSWNLQIMIIILHAIAFLGGFLLDSILGDPNYFFHPVRLIGLLISSLDTWLMGDRESSDEKKSSGDDIPNYKAKSGQDKTELIKGVFMTLTVTAAAAALSFVILFAAYEISSVLGCVIELIMTYQIMAARCLEKESMKVYTRLKENDISGARQAVSMIVGRDTDILDAEGVARAAVETVAESTCDGVIAPMLYTALGGPVLGMIYKAINTLDSMLGYKSRRYMFFGRASAKLDDFANWLPARIGALLLIAAAGFARGEADSANALRIWRRDARKHASPNAGQCEAAVAGALHIRLAGDTVYGKRIVRKPYIGDASRNVSAEDIKITNKLMYIAAIISLILFLLGIMWVGKLFFYLNDTRILSMLNASVKWRFS